VRLPAVTSKSDLMTRSERVVLVVGASSGIGRAAAELLAARGHLVFGSARQAARVGARGVQSVSLEVSDPDSIAQAVASVRTRAGRLDAVVYSAGFYVAGAAEETSDELAAAQFDVYFFGAHRVTRAVLPWMRAQGHGRLIYMSSSAAVAAVPFHALYSSSKAALEHYVEALRYETEPLGIRLACVQGTGVRTAAADRSCVAESSIPAYEPARGRVIEAFKQAQRRGSEPTTFAVAIAAAVEAKRMRPLYRVGNRARMLPYLKRVLPERVFRKQFVEFFLKGVKLN
jgi:NAD(P)-dependent dehydrogenase (short-subunit alcohol dehydrogenase family)